MRSRVELPLLVDRDAGQPLNVQIAVQLRDALREGGLPPGERLPSTRGLASLLGVSRTVVTDAYEQLYAEGWLEGRHGSGTYAAQNLTVSMRHFPHDTAPEEPAGDQGVIDLRPGKPWTKGIEIAVWRRVWRLAARAGPVDEPDPRGLVSLREAVAAYVRRGRGVACGAGDVVITQGATAALDLLAATMLRPGDRAGVEEPGYPYARSVLAARGVEVVPCPVDDHGLIVDALPSDLRLVYTTPSHQYPLGGVLPVPRRQALVGWARRTGAVIAEDDYDSEFRYDVAPLPALYGLGPDVTVYLGSTAKTLAPDVGVGWLVARPGIAGPIAQQRQELGDRTAVVPQEAMRILLECGDLDRHVRRMRAEYARRRHVVVELLGPAGIRGETAGLHVVAELPSGAVGDVIRRAEERGVLLSSLDRFHMTEPAIHGLMIGYGSASLADVRAGCSLVRALLPEGHWRPAA